MKIRLFKSRSIFLSWLATYFLLLLMPIVISTVVYFEAFKIVKADIIDENRQALKQVKIAIDNGMQDVRNFSAFVAFNQNLNLLMQEKDLNIINGNYYQVNSVLNELKSYKFQNEYIEDFYVYFRQVDSVLTTNGFYDSKYFFNYYQKGTIYRDIMSYTDWKKKINAEYTGDYLAFNQKLEENGTGGESVVFINSLPIFGVSQPNATFVISLNNSKFYDSINSILSANEAWGIIIDSNDNVLFSMRPLKNPFPVKFAAMPKDSDLLYDKVDGEDVVISYISSGVEKWKYISVIPLQVFQEKVAYIRNLIVVCILFSILLGGIFAWLFSRRNYRPINELIHNLEKKFRPPSDKEFNEYRFIQGAMDDTFNEKDAINERLRQQNLILRSNFLVKLLKGRFEDNSFITKSLEAYKLDFESGSFAVMLFYLSGFNAPAGSEKKAFDKKLELTKLIITNVAEEMAGRKNKGYVTEADSMLACIINFKGLDAVENKREMLSVAAEFTALMHDEFNLEMLVTVSDIHETLFGIPDAYQEALSVMEYKKVMEASDIVAYDQISISNQGYSYSIEAERQLINCIKSGDLEAAILSISDIYEKNFTKTVLSAGMTKCLVFDLVGTIFKTVSETNILREGSFIQELDIAGRLLDSEDFQEMKQQMTGILKEICTYIQRNKKSRKNSLLDEVVDYIENNYQDANLSVSQIADKFQLTPAYLTRLFKEQSGEGLLDYITELRMEKAKQLLKKQGFNIKDVAVKVGYYSSTAFIRTFKKMEGVTPGSYKDID